MWRGWIAMGTGRSMTLSYSSSDFKGRGSSEAQPDLKALESRLLVLLREVEKRERVVEVLTKRLEESFSSLLLVMEKLRALGEERAPFELRQRVKETYSELFAIANDLEELREEVAKSRETIQRMLALIELLKERGARR